MSERFQVQKATSEFSTFIRSLSPIQARVVGLGDFDPPFEYKSTVQVSRQQMLTRFLAIRPNYNQFREQLSQVMIKLPEFTVVQERWQESLPVS